MADLEVIIAGFGGQGVLSLGQILAQAGMLDGQEVSWIPSYGPEMRGGTANCTVIISGREVGSPVVADPSACIVLNRPSLDKFEPAVKPGGILIINSSLIDVGATRKDLRVVRVPANDIADELGNSRLVGMVTLGALIELSKAVTVEAVMESLKKVLPPHRHKLIPANRRAVERGMEYARQHVESQGL